MAFEAAQFNGAIFLRNSVSVDVDPILFSMNKVVPHVITFRGRRRFLLQRYGSKLSEKTKFVYFSANSTVDSILADVAGASSCVIDGIDLLLSILGVDNVAKLIQRLKSSSNVFAGFPSIVVTDAEWNRLLPVADSYFSLTEEGGGIIVNGVSYKKNGKRITLRECVEVLPDLSLKSSRVENAPATVTADTSPSPSAPFNMGFVLKETERAAKEQMQLPYMSSTNVEGLVTLRSSEKKVRVGGQIIYTPDDGDDLDDSDPDDDLNL